MRSGIKAFAPSCPLALAGHGRAGHGRENAETVRKYVTIGLQVAVETDSGQGSSIADTQFAEAGAEIAPGSAEALAGADLVLAVQMPGAEVRAVIPRGALPVCVSGAASNPALVQDLAAAGIEVVAMERLLPTCVERIIPRPVSATLSPVRNPRRRAAAPGDPRCCCCWSRSYCSGCSGGAWRRRGMRPATRPAPSRARPAGARAARSG